MKRYLLPLLALSLTTSLGRADGLTLASAPEAGSALDLPSAAPAVSADLENLALQMVTVEAHPAATSLFSFLSGDSDTRQAEPDMATLYNNAVKAQRLARVKQGILAVNMIRQEQQALLEAADKSLVEREEARVGADTATPEASPAACPFSLERPENLVSTRTNSSIESLTGAIDLNSNIGLTSTPEPTTWALFGLGAAFLVYAVPGRRLKLSPSSVQIKS